MEGRITFRDFVPTVILFFFLCGVCLAGVKNGGFEEVLLRQKDEPEIEDLLRRNWSFDVPILWPKDWTANPFYRSTGIILKISDENPHSGKKCLFLGQNPNAAGWALAQTVRVEKGYYRISFWARGEGKVGAVINNSFQIVPSVEATADWRKYEGALRNRAGYMKEITIILGAVEPGAYFDDVACEKCTVLDAELIDESNDMKAKGLWLHKDGEVKPKEFELSVRFVWKLVANLGRLLEADPRPERVRLIDLMKKRIGELRALKARSLAEMNEVRALTNIAKRLQKEMSFRDVAE